MGKVEGKRRAGRRRNSWIRNIRNGRGRGQGRSNALGKEQRGWRGGELSANVHWWSGTKRWRVEQLRAQMSFGRCCRSNKRKRPFDDYHDWGRMGMSSSRLWAEYDDEYIIRFAGKTWTRISRTVRWVALTRVRFRTATSSWEIRRCSPYWHIHDMDLSKFSNNLDTFLFDSQWRGKHWQWTVFVCFLSSRLAEYEAFSLGTRRKECIVAR